MSASDLLGALALGAVVLAWPVGSVVIGFFLDGRKRRGRSGQRPLGFWDEIEATQLQRHRKRQAVKQLRATARRARRESSR
ncbi:hypothetical protein ACFQ9X_23765 [Catenulispora yoronensis]